MTDEFKQVGCQFDMLNDDMPYDLSLSRRDLIRTAAALPLAAAGANAAAVDAASGFHLGIASYTLRTLTRTKAIAALKDLDIKYVSIKDFHAKMKATPEESVPETFITTVRPPV